MVNLQETTYCSLRVQNTFHRTRSEDTYTTYMQQRLSWVVYSLYLLSKCREAIILPLSWYSIYV